MIKCYIAGRIEQSRKRFGLVDCDLSSSERDSYSTIINERPFTYKGDELIYMGPFTLSCDHGCSHRGRYERDIFGTCNHGSGVPLCEGGISDGVDNDDMKDLVFYRSFIGIEMCDFMFVWIKDLECFGSLTEIGFAFGIDKPIYIGIPEKFKENEIWFALKCANGIVYNDDVYSAFGIALEQYKNHIKLNPKSI